MELLQSKVLKLPKIFYIWNKEDIRNLPVGVPYIYGDKKDKEYIIRLLEYEVLFQSAKKTGFSFNFKKILEDNGFKDLIKYQYSNPVFVEYTESESGFDRELVTGATGVTETIADFVKDSAAYVDIAKLKSLKIMPVWMDVVEDAVTANIHDFGIYEWNAYNKKLDGMFGTYIPKTKKRNLWEVDISSSIPRAVSVNTLLFSKNSAESFYCDLLITGSKTTLYDYNELHKLDVETIYKENGMDNDQAYFLNLVKEPKEYGTVICFGDNHHPGQPWRNEFNINTFSISIADGKKLCKWTVDKVISFHTNNNKELAGYATWFSPKEVIHITDWVKYMD